MRISDWSSDVCSSDLLAAEREELTDAKDRFAARLGRDIGMQLATAWRDKLAIEPELDSVTADPAKLAAVRADDELFVQRFTLRGAPFDGRTIMCAYPVDRQSVV